MRPVPQIKDARRHRQQADRARADDEHFGSEIRASFHAWLTGRVPAGEADPSRTAWALLALIEGVVVLNAVGHGDNATGAAGLLLGEQPPA
jgi:hypothetical protein